MAGAAMAAAHFLLLIKYSLLLLAGHESANSCNSKLNYGVIDAQADISDDRQSSSLTERIQVPQKRIRSANESEAFVPRFVVEAGNGVG